MEQETSLPCSEDLILIHLNKIHVPLIFLYHISICVQFFLKISTSKILDLEFSVPYTPKQ